MEDSAPIINNELASLVKKTSLEPTASDSTTEISPVQTPSEQSQPAPSAALPIVQISSNDDEDDFPLEVSDPIAKAVSNLGGITKAPKTHIKFSSAETEANTNANSYFGPGGIGSPLIDSSNGRHSRFSGLTDTDVSDIEERSRSRTQNRSRSRSRGPHTAHWGVEGHFIDPNSPSAAFEHRVAFDTFDNKNATDFSLTLRSKHEDYQYTRLSRTFLCGTDKNKYSDNAISWLLNELADDGDEIVCLRVIDSTSKIANTSSDKASEEKLYREEAHEFLEHIMAKNTKGRKISLVLEFALGDVQSLIKRMIQIYEPSVLVVGTKGRSIEGFKGLLPGSVSKWCLQHSPIPVVVVKPRQKRENKKAKREANPNKLAYIDMIAAHPDEPTKVYNLHSSSGLLSPQLPSFLKHAGFSVSTPTLFGGSSSSLVSSSSTRSPRGDNGDVPERLGRFDRVRARSPLGTNRS
jgi:nucleotide-binding universal stress UspA family protein